MYVIVLDVSVVVIRYLSLLSLYVTVIHIFATYVLMSAHGQGDSIKLLNLQACLSVEFYQK